MTQAFRLITNHLRTYQLTCVYIRLVECRTLWSSDAILRAVPRPLRHNRERVLGRTTSESDAQRPTVEEELTKEYTVSGGKIIVHGASEQDLVLTDDEQSSFQETMEQFAEEVSDMAQFHPLNIYKNNVEWSGDLLRFDVRFYYSISEVEGTYIGNANMIKVDNKFMEVLGKVKSFYNTFESKWAKVSADRRTTEVEKEENQSLVDKEKKKNQQI